MGSLDASLPLKQRPTPLAAAAAAAPPRRPFFHRPRSRLARFLLFEKVDFLQWALTAAAFFFVLILFQSFLPGSVVERSTGGWGPRRRRGEDLGGRIRDLDFGEGIRFVPSKLKERLRREKMEASSALSALGRPVTRAGLRPPRIAMVVPDLLPGAMQLEMISISAALKEIGYDVQVYSFKDGPLHSIWETAGMHVSVLPIDINAEKAVDWSEYNGILINSLEARTLVSCLLQEPFKSIPLIWTIHERSLSLRLSQYVTNGQIQLINDWKQVFSRATVVVFPSYIFPMSYSTFDTGNYYVVPGSPAEAWEADKFLALHREHDVRVTMGFRTDDFIVIIVGSQFSYSGMWLEHALVLQAVASLIREFIVDDTPYSRLRIGILSGNSTSIYKMAMENVALSFGYPRGSVELLVADGDLNSFLGVADLVIYGSFLEEQSFPPILLQAMSLGKLIVAPDLAIIRKYVDDGLNGYLFPKENIGMLGQVLLKAISDGKLSPFAQKIASIGKEHARNLMASESILGYALLLENILNFPSEVACPKAVTEIPSKFKEEWQWHLFENLTDVNNFNQQFRSSGIIDKLEEQWNHTQMVVSTNKTSREDEAFSAIVWEEEKMIQMEISRKRLEEYELKDRTEQPHGTWEEVYRSAKRADRAKNELHERDERELERTGQPLCIYEPFMGEGTWPFLHNTSLYRGVSLSSKGRRLGGDDVDASSRLPLLSNPYYRDVLVEFGAFFALANRVDRIHKNAWIGFQSWRVVARKASLSKKAEASLLEAIHARRHGDALYFWVRMDRDLRIPVQQDFWSFCDAINAGNCRFAFSDALRRMYGAHQDIISLPPMPNDGDSWSVFHSWALPTRSFLEFVMFSRMFVDALDAQMYDKHHQTGHCYLSLSKDTHCYSRVLELLINVWAYHSARRMVYVNPETGVMQEQHKLKGRRGQMWIRWFSYTTLKSMDEDLAEEADSDRSDRRWLWPSTGEVFWQGIYDRERSMRQQQKERRKQQSKDKIQRIKKRAKQKTIGKYIKPLPEVGDDSNTTRTIR